MSKTIRIGGACLNQTPIDWRNNLSNIQSAIAHAKEEGTEILCLPELCITGYGCEDLFLSQWLHETAMEKLSEIVLWTSDIAVCVGLPMVYEDKLYNVTCLIQNQKIIGFYAKQRLAIHGVHYEGRWFSAWQSARLKSIEIDGTEYPFGHFTTTINDVRVGFEICEDAWVDDRPICYVQEQVDLVLNPSASHFAFKKAHFREEHIVIDSSREYKCIYLYANLLGNEAGRMIYDGDILIAQNGTLIARNRRFSFENYRLLSVEVSLDTVIETKIKPDFESQNEEFTHAASLALFDYMRKSKSNGFVLSLSGGADSSTIAVLVTLALRRALQELGIEAFENRTGIKIQKDEEDIIRHLFTTAYQATVNSSKETFESAKFLAESLGATFYNWSIDEQVNGAKNTIEQAIGRKLSWENDDITLQNIQSRARSPIIWMLANLKNALLLATSNRSEGDVGYTTMDGDTSGSISPIAGVSKHFVRQWLKYAESELGFEGLKYVNRLTPTAELRPEEQHQTDEEDLMPYEVLVKIEREAILKGSSPLMVFNALKYEYEPDQLKDWIKKFFQLWTRNQWKRERFAPSFHFDDFNIDPRSWYRFPILSGGYQEELAEL
jgi:NAD+ synthase (glutamine-hydrolysing)